MTASLRRLLPALLLLVLACGESREEKRQDRIEEFCNQLVGKTLRDGEVELSVGSWDRGLVIPVRIDPCRTTWEPLSGNDVCPYSDETEICLLGWNFVSNDPNACDARGCWYACMVHVTAEDLLAATDDLGGVNTAEVPICASKFTKGQPLPVLR